jgi:hypothetical protein
LMMGTFGNFTIVHASCRGLGGSLYL